VLPELTPDCVVGNLEVTFYAKGNLPAATARGETLAELVLLDNSTPITVQLFNLELLDNRPLTGAGIGRDCVDRSTFKEGAPAFPGSGAPYNADYRPSNPRNFDLFKGKRASRSRWELSFVFLDDTLSIECWSLKLFLTRVPNRQPETADENFVP